MFKLRKSNERGLSELEWLKSYHSFSFAEYYDPKHLTFRALRVINEDWIAPSKGFPLHGHENMEIITYVIEGALEHRDTLGNRSRIQPGEIQRMSAGSGIEHSEYNPLPDKKVHLLQIWILPEKKNIPPSYAQRNFYKEMIQKDLLLLASRDGRENSLILHQDVDLHLAQLKAEQELSFALRPSRHLWLQIIKGKIQTNEFVLEDGDALAISEENFLKFKALLPSEILLFDLA